MSPVFTEMQFSPGDRSGLADSCLHTTFGLFNEAVQDLKILRVKVHRGIRFVVILFVLVFGCCGAARAARAQTSEASYQPETLRDRADILKAYSKNVQ